MIRIAPVSVINCMVPWVPSFAPFCSFVPHWIFQKYQYNSWQNMRPVWIWSLTPAKSSALIWLIGLVRKRFSFLLNSPHVPNLQSQRWGPLLIGGDEYATKLPFLLFLTSSQFLKVTSWSNAMTCWVGHAKPGWNRKHLCVFWNIVYEIHYSACCDRKMNVLKVKDGDLDTNIEPEQEKIVNIFEIQHKAYPQWPKCHLLS